MRWGGAAVAPGRSDCRRSGGDRSPRAEDALGRCRASPSGASSRTCATPRRSSSFRAGPPTSGVSRRSAGDSRGSIPTEVEMADEADPPRRRRERRAGARRPRAHPRARRRDGPGGAGLAARHPGLRLRRRPPRGPAPGPARPFYDRGLALASAPERRGRRDGHDRQPQGGGRPAPPRRSGQRHLLRPRAAGCGSTCCSTIRSRLARWPTARPRSGCARSRFESPRRTICCASRGSPSRRAPGPAMPRTSRFSRPASGSGPELTLPGARGQPIGQPTNGRVDLRREAVALRRVARLDGVDDELRRERAEGAGEADRGGDAQRVARGVPERRDPVDLVGREAVDAARRPRAPAGIDEDDVVEARPRPP